MMSWVVTLLGWCTSSGRSVRAIAGRHVQLAHHGEVQVISTKLRAVEQERWVVLVFYRCKMPVRPAPYEVVMVDRASRLPAIASCVEGARYRLANYK